VAEAPLVIIDAKQRREDLEALRLFIIGLRQKGKKVAGLADADTPQATLRSLGVGLFIDRDGTREKMTAWLKMLLGEK
jgi:hypothetical protein